MPVTRRQAQRGRAAAGAAATGPSAYAPCRLASRLPASRRGALCWRSCLGPSGFTPPPRHSLREEIRRWGRNLAAKGQLALDFCRRDYVPLQPIRRSCRVLPGGSWGCRVAGSLPGHCRVLGAGLLPRVAARRASLPQRLQGHCARALLAKMRMRVQRGGEISISIGAVRPGPNRCSPFTTSA